MSDEVVDYLRGPRLWVPRADYPDFDEWVERVRAQLRTEEKRAVVALDRRGVCGAVVYQRHRSEPGALEVKNVTVRPDQRGRLLASFMLRNAEAEGASELGATRCLVDAKARNLGIRSFLLKSGYLPVGASDLYGLGAGEDVVYRKSLRPAGSVAR